MQPTITSEKDLKSLSDELLDQSLLTYVRKEKEVLKEILCHIAEVDRRRLYLTLGYSSLYVYLTERLGYDSGSAQRRLDAARLSLMVPSVIEQIDQGEITLSQVTCLQKSLRQLKEQKISAQTKAEILASIKHKSLEETQAQVSQALNIEIKEAPKVKHQADESVRLEVTLSKTQWEKMKTMRELLSNTLPTGEWDQVLEYLATKVIEQKRKTPSTQSLTPASKHQASSSKHLSVKLKQAALLRDRCCQYKDQRSGKLCGSRWRLEVDHIHPLWAEGANTLENLRVLCANHNQELYRRQASIRRV
jgi:HNH endonuclease